jgi:hypothetical protein
MMIGDIHDIHAGDSEGRVRGEGGRDGGRAGSVVATAAKELQERRWCRLSWPSADEATIDDPVKASIPAASW